MEMLVRFHFILKSILNHKYGKNNRKNNRNFSMVGVLTLQCFSDLK